MTKKEQMKWAKRLFLIGSEHRRVVQGGIIAPWDKLPSTTKKVYCLAARDFIAEYERSKEPSHA